ncbi:MAG TPA: protein phosphatase 2C domain-containing protein [Haliangiales bacterium]|nr:protein phosphatase 2C domain-containing protein [Haliangiales bacterium]
MKFSSWSLTDVGRKRDHNEDSFLCDDALRLYAVADGMGGHQGGGHASRMAVDILRREITGAGDLDEAARAILDADPMSAVLPQELGALFAKGSRAPAAPSLVRWGETAAEDSYEDISDMPTDPNLTVIPPAAATVLRAAARIAGRAIYDAAQAEAELAGMGTTLTALLFHGGRAHFVHVGDSRAFLFRDGKAYQVTEDHSWIAEQVRAGVLTDAEARESKFRHIITRSVGFEREVDVDLLGVPVMPGDAFVLCSDGLSNYVDAAELGLILASTFACKVPRLLVDLANDRGGDDNVTVVVVNAANDAA